MNSEQKAIFAIRLGELRNEKGLSQEELSSAVQIDRGTIAKYETQKRIPSYEHLTSFAVFFGVSTDYLLGLTDNKTTNTELQSVCEYTGLSDTAIQALMLIKGSDLSRDISFLLSDMGQCVNASIYTNDPNCGADISLLQKISLYFNTFNTENNQRLYISKSGKIIDSASTDKEYTSKLSYQDCIAIRGISIDEIIDRIMLNDIEKSLDRLKSISLDSNPKYQKYLDGIELPF